MRTMTDVAAISRITRRTDARDLALAAYDQLFTLLDSLNDADWRAQTECPAWIVADMVGHLIGAGESNASLVELNRQQLWGLRHKGDHDGNSLDACNAHQVASHAGLNPSERVAALKALAPRAVRGRMRWAPYFRPVTIPLDTTGSAAPGMPNRLNLGHLYEVIYTRDIWLHTIDIWRAVGREPDVSAPLNRRVIEDVVAEWARRHGQPFELTLTGPAGGSYRSGDAGDRITLDAVEFALTLSGRAEGKGLLATRVMF
jgi:uncharacterized protein (TIGR03083 family)